MVTVQGVDYPVQFLRSETMEPDEVMVQNAINQVEFTLGQAIRLGMRQRRPVVGSYRVTDAGSRRKPRTLPIHSPRHPMWWTCSSTAV